MTGIGSEFSALCYFGSYPKNGIGETATVMNEIDRLTGLQEDVAAAIKGLCKNARIK